jgi:hypothetical protein
MHRDHQIIAVIPAGRSEYLKILYKYLLLLRPTLDKVIFWLNTENKRDINFIHLIQESTPDFFEIEYLPTGQPCLGCDSIHHFFRKCTKPKHIYVRFDDDIVYVDDMTHFCTFLDFRINNPQFLFVFPNIINNAYVSYYHNKNKIIDHTVDFQRMCMGNQWASMDFVEYQHTKFLEDLRHGYKDRWYFDQEEVVRCDRVSINSMAWLGEEFAKFEGKIGVFEEWYTTVQLPALTNKDSCIYGQFIVCHYAYFNQRHYLDNCTNILEQYDKLINPCNISCTDIAQCSSIYFLKNNIHCSKHGFHFGVNPVLSSSGIRYNKERIFMFDPHVLVYNTLPDIETTLIIDDVPRVQCDEKYGVTVPKTGVDIIAIYNTCNLRYPGFTKIHIYLENNTAQDRYDILYKYTKDTNKNIAYQWFIQHFNIPSGPSGPSGPYLLARAVHHGKLVPICAVLPYQNNILYELKLQSFIDIPKDYVFAEWTVQSNVIYKLNNVDITLVDQTGIPCIIYYVNDYRVSYDSGADIDGLDIKYPTYKHDHLCINSYALFSTFGNDEFHATISGQSYLLRIQI